MTISTTAVIIIINVGVFIFGLLGYVIWNLLRKNEKLEDMNVVQDNYISNISTIMTESNKKNKRNRFKTNFPIR